MTPKNRLVLLLQCASGLSAMSYGVMFTVLDDFRDKYGITESKLGLIVGAGFITGFIANIFIAPYADKGHAKTLIRIGIALQFIGCIIMSVGASFPVLLLGRFLTGLGGGAADPALRRIIILANPHEMGNNLGRLVSAGVAGFSLGPAVSAVTVDQFGLAAPFLIVAGILAIIFVGVTRMSVTEADISDAPPQKLAFDLLRIRALTGVIVIGLALFVMIGTFDSIWSVMMDDKNAPSWVASLGITVFALPMIFIAPIGGRFTQRIGPIKASVGGLSLGVVFMTLYGTLASPYAMVAVGLCHGLVDGMTVTGGSASVALVAPRERLAAAQGLYGGLQTLMGGVAAGLAGVTYEAIQQRAYVACAVVMVFLIGGGLWLAKDSIHIAGDPAEI